MRFKPNGWCHKNWEVGFSLNPTDLHLSKKANEFSPLKGGWNVNLFTFRPTELLIGYLLKDIRLCGATINFIWQGQMLQCCTPFTHSFIGRFFVRGQFGGWKDMKHSFIYCTASFRSYNPTVLFIAVSTWFCFWSWLYNSICENLVAGFKFWVW